MVLLIEMLMTWGYYSMSLSPPWRKALLTGPDYLNRNGSTIGSKVLLVVVSVLNAARNSFSFFLLLIVCMGYGVVKPTLGRTMIYVRWLAIAHFVFGIAYAITNFVITPENASKYSLTFQPSPKACASLTLPPAQAYSSSSSCCPWPGP